MVIGTGDDHRVYPRNEQVAVGRRQMTVGREQVYRIRHQTPISYSGGMWR